MLEAFLVVPFGVLSNGLFSDAWFALLLGLLVGSFLNVCIYRWPLDLSIVRPRSHCPACEKTIAWYDNIPLLSFAILGGRCRHCHARISARYPVVEALTGALFFLVVHRWGLTPVGGKMCLFTAMLVVLFFSDLEERILPDEITVWGTVLGLVLAVFAPTPDTTTQLLMWLAGAGATSWIANLGAAAIAAFVPSGALWFAGRIFHSIRHRDGLGFGDVKMVALLGCFLGLDASLLTLILGSFSGALLGLAYIKLTHKDSSTYELPFGTFLAGAALAVVIFSPRLFAW